MAENRRVRMTKKMIWQAFFELLENKSPDKITVTELCRQADVNRSTFYTYYDGIDAMIREGEEYVIERLTADIPQGTANEAALTARVEGALENIRRNRALYRALLVNWDSDSFNRRLVGALIDRSIVGNSEQSHYACTYYVNGIIGILRQWLTDGCPTDSQRLAGFLIQLTVQARRRKPRT